MATSDVISLESCISLTFDDFAFDPIARKLRKAGALVKIDSKPLELLEVFLRSPQKVLSRDELLDRVWHRRFVAESALSVAVAKLRKVLGKAADGLITSKTAFADSFSLAANRTSIRLSSAIVDAIHRCSQQQPLLLVLDDLQWAGAATLHTLSLLVSEIRGRAILISATVRDSELASHAPTKTELRRLLSRRDCNRIELSRLGQLEVEEYLKQMFGTSNPELSRDVYLRSEGTPLLLVELLRPWANASMPEPTQLRLPDLALDIMRERLRSLPADALRVLSIAAVVGRHFDLGLVSKWTAVTPLRCSKTSMRLSPTASSKSPLRSRMPTSSFTS